MSLDRRMVDSFENYRELHDALAEAGVPIPPAELHGGLCGTLCSGGNAAARAWLDRCLDGARGSPERLESLRGRLSALESGIVARFEDDQLGFQPCLPGEEEAIGERVEALASWCHGFLAGLGLGGVDLSAEASNAPAELNEIVGDLAEISKATVEPNGGDAEDGFAFAELTEYVRVGAQYVYEVLNDAAAPRRGTLH